MIHVYRYARHDRRQGKTWRLYIDNGYVGIYIYRYIVTTHDTTALAGWQAGRLAQSVSQSVSQSGIQYNTILYNTLLYATLLYSTLCYSTLLEHVEERRRRRRRKGAGISKSIRSRYLSSEYIVSE